jgi:hypothetical protein
MDGAHIGLYSAKYRYLLGLGDRSMGSALEDRLTWGLAA